jgi:ubiquinone/menaquinone biosynthesis C-methylase UbiE
MVVGLLSRLHIYEERTGKYLNHFKHYVDDAGIVVDVGCGTGVFSKALASNRQTVIALDIESKLLEGFEDPYIEKVCADAQQLPLRDGSVDAVLSLSLLEHLGNPDKCVQELYRALKQGAAAIIQLPNLQYLFEPHTKLPLLGFMPKRVQSKILRMIDYSYINFDVTVKNALLILQKSGFKLEKAVKVYHLGIMKLLPVAPAYIFIARKVRILS